MTFDLFMVKWDAQYERHLVVSDLQALGSKFNWFCKEKK